MSGIKLFVNETPYPLSILLTPRVGSTPGHEGAPVNLMLKVGQSSNCRYGNDQNPYLDGISVNIVENGSVMSTQNFVLTRGSAVDDDFNTHNTVYFALSGETIVLRFANT